MPHIHLPEGLPGIVSGFAFRPETARPMRELAEILLRGPSSLTSGEREMIATFVSTRNDCYFCQTSHRAAAAHHLDGNYELVDAVRFNHQHAPVSAKLKALLEIAGKVQQDGKAVLAEDIEADPHFRARAMLETVTLPDGKSFELPGVVPKLSETPGATGWLGPRLGEHTDEVLATIDITGAELDELRSNGIV